MQMEDLDSLKRKFLPFFEVDADTYFEVKFST